MVPLIVSSYTSSRISAMIRLFLHVSSRIALLIENLYTFVSASARLRRIFLNPTNLESSEKKIGNGRSCSSNSKKGGMRRFLAFETRIVSRLRSICSPEAELRGMRTSALGRRISIYVSPPMRSKSSSVISGGGVGSSTSRTYCVKYVEKSTMDLLRKRSLALSTRTSKRYQL